MSKRILGALLLLCMPMGIDALWANLPDNSFIISTPIALPAEWLFAPGELQVQQPNAHTEQPQRFLIQSKAGCDVEILDFYLESNTDHADTINLCVEFANSGIDTIVGLQLDFFTERVEAPCKSHTFGMLVPAQIVEYRQSWEVVDGTVTLFAILDAENQITELDETNNVDSLQLSLIAGVPYVWQEVNGYCHYASLTMLFNYLGYSHSVTQTVELCSAPHSYMYAGELFAGVSGIFISQKPSDLRRAGRIRNLSDHYAAFFFWEPYWLYLMQNAKAGIPVEVGVDPYYLPQPDYDICRQYDLHSGHAVVVVGMTYDQIVLHDPGVGLQFGEEPPLPDPPLRGKYVVLDKSQFKVAVENHPSPYLAIAYTSSGEVVSDSDLFQQSVEFALHRLDGDVAFYDPSLQMISEMEITFGLPALRNLRDDLIFDNFKPVFDSTLQRYEGDLIQALTSILQQATYFFPFNSVAWQASSEFYRSQEVEGAERIAVLSDSLADLSDDIFDKLIRLCEVLYIANGDLNYSKNWLIKIQELLSESVCLQEEIRTELPKLISPSSAEINLARTIHPEACTIVGNYPNPFNSQTTVRWIQPASGNVSLHIFNALGQKIRRYEPKLFSAGTHSIRWDGGDAAMKDAASGLYICRLKFENKWVAEKKMILLR
ncbi:T9SS type A sorting domain-containing protein [candidate division KSB1 bacterium]|nr:T9SS type A sorting domain-containing protein [candidate division KSB1 bacterium]